MFNEQIKKQKNLAHILCIFLLTLGGIILCIYWLMTPQPSIAENKISAGYISASEYLSDKETFAFPRSINRSTVVNTSTNAYSTSSSFDTMWLSPEASYSRDVALGDMDGDGDLDIFVGNHDQSNKLYRNDENGIFTDITAGDLIDLDFTSSVAWGDMDGDGDLDILVGNWNQTNKVYRNDGNGIFTDITAGDITGSIDYTTSVAWGDMDGDGDLDILIGNRTQINRVYRNDGNEIFTDVTSGDLTTDLDSTESIAWGDMDGDNDLDILIGNDHNPQTNKVYRNDGGVFINVTAGDLAVDTYPTSSVAWGDADGNGTLDIFVGIRNQANKVYRNDGNGVFTDITAGDLATDTDDTSSVSLGDVDSDGDLDILVGNEVQRNKVYRNDGSGIFTDVTSGNLATDTDDTRSVTWGDMDGDGDLDVLINNWDQANKLYQNNSGSIFTDATAGDLVTNPDPTSSIALGDMDEDGDLDVFVGNWDGVNRLYQNNGDGVFTDITTGDLAIGADPTSSVAWGDMDGDGDLDILEGRWQQTNQLFRNDGNGVFTNVTAGDLAVDVHKTRVMIWGDMDGDGDLDIFAGNRNQTNIVYRNDGGAFTDVTTGDLMTSADLTYSAAWGDMDGDGDMDILVGNVRPYHNKVYRNDGNGVFTDVTDGNLATDTDETWSVAWGDMDGDGDLDIITGNRNQVNKLYHNEGNGVFINATDGDLAIDTDDTWSLALGDIGGDGDMDILAGNSGSVSKLYRNDGDGVFTNITAGDLAIDINPTNSIAWGDLDGDGDIDILAGNRGAFNRVYSNSNQDFFFFKDNPGSIHLSQPYDLPAANFYSMSGTLQSQMIPITYTFSTENGESIGHVDAYYSVNGGGVWKTAVLSTHITNTVLRNNNLSMVNKVDNTQFYRQQPSIIKNQTLTGEQCIPECTKLLYWDTFSSGFFGQSDNVILRLVTTLQTATPAIVGTYQYTNSIAGPYMYTAPSATTLPFRIRGTQVQVFTNTVAAGNELAGARVYQLESDLNMAIPMANPQTNSPWLTNSGGYLQGSGELRLGDQIVALHPIDLATLGITFTDKISAYYTSSPAIISGLEMTAVTQPGVQELVVSADNPLILFNLDMALEWDARNDPEFLENLDNALKLASEVLFDASNGQMALGEVRVTLNKENWLGADVVLYASSSIRPMANIGGVVNESTPDIGVTGVLTDAFTPGQVRLGSSWDPYGISTVDLGQDWQQALAHELSHYLLFLPDNYIGIQNGNLIDIDCVGSMMTSEDYSEFLRPDEWTGDCLNTIAAQETGRSDWETVTNFYPWLDGKAGVTQLNSGPATLPLAVTQMTLIEPVGTSAVLPARFFDVRAGEGVQELLLLPRAEGYLHKTNSTLLDESDDRIIELGKTGGGGDRLYVRGAEVGDRVCINDATSGQYGCVTVTATNSSVYLYLLPDWQADIESTPVTSRTMAITVTVPVNVPALTLQVIPAYGAEATPDVVTATVATMNTADGGLTWSETITLPHPAFEGIIRVYVPGAIPEREMIAAYTLNSAFWGGSRRGWGGSRRGWGGSRRGWGAPISSGDGQVTVFNADDPFGQNGISSLQALPTLPNLPSWLTPVGKGYRVLQEASYDPQGDQRYISFNYLESQVPSGYEYALHIYHTVDGQTWQRLDTRIDDLQNMATAVLVDEANGSYALVVTVDIAPFDTGWNNFGYPIPETNPITTTLASIEGKYTMVAHFDGVEWLTYDPAVALQHPQFVPTVNTLANFQFTEAYWLNATEPVTLSVGVPGSNVQSGNLMNTLSLPPAVYFGWIIDGGITPTAGDTIEALVDGTVCGTATIFELDDNLAYRVNVLSETLFGDPNGCGTDGAIVSFRVGGQQLSDTASWKNSMAWYLPLAMIHESHIYLPLITVE